MEHKAIYAPSGAWSADLQLLPFATPLALAVAAALAIVDWATWIQLNVAILYGLPLVIAAVTRDRRLLWTLTFALVAVTFGVYALQVGGGPPAARVSFFINRLLAACTILLGAGILHAWMQSMDRLVRRDEWIEQQNAALEAVNLELVASKQEILRQNAALEQSRLDLEGASQRKTQMLASLSHDIRTPIQAITLLSELMRRTAERPEGALAAFYATRGAVGRHGAEDGTARIERFTPFERSAHWANAIAFVILALSGIVMAFGKFFLLPLLGLTLFGYLTYALKTLHNFAGPLFAVSLAIVFLTFLRDNWPQRGDLRWLLQGGGMLRKSGEEPPSHRFNAGEKLVFWGGVLLLGALVVASGLVMNRLVPGLAYPRSTMQLAHMVHNTSAVLMLCVFAGHIYLGTIGMRGAYTAMRRGTVGDAWAKEHHAYWYEDVRSGKVPAQRSRPAGGEATAAGAETPAPAGGAAT